MDVKELTARDIFECRLCGQCCNGFGGTYITRSDIENIAAFIKADPATFVETYCDMSGSRPVLTLNHEGTCIFFDPDKQCTIHPVKPYMCRAWPYIKTIIKNPENWDIMANSCPGMRKGIPGKDLQRIVAMEKEKLDRSYDREE
ncbi:MAG TPA: YkgJ family cysteine cluster protein [Desulfobacteraceae bacterium]|nr:YkgJ family cysteine cluster protein [Desulfobacteraceae bacterium]|tara:strand:- start:323 stop:754 length:432 start_codon:yes stop_codon:yes gene_type:complete